MKNPGKPGFFALYRLVIIWGGTFDSRRTCHIILCFPKLGPQNAAPEKMGCKMDVWKSVRGILRETPDNLAVCGKMIKCAPRYNDKRKKRGSQMFAQIVIGSNDILAAKEFYDAVLGTVGVPEGNFVEEKKRIYYRTSDSTFIVAKPNDGNPATVANGGTLGFKCKTPEQAKAFHDAAVANGGLSIEDPPGWRNLGSGQKIYLAYVRDLSGHKLCATHYP